MAPILLIYFLKHSFSEDLNAVFKLMNPRFTIPGSLQLKCRLADTTALEFCPPGSLLSSFLRLPPPDNKPTCLHGSVPILWSRSWQSFHILHSCHHQIRGCTFQYSESDHFNKCFPSANHSLFSPRLFLTCPHAPTLLSYNLLSFKILSFPSLICA